MDKTQLDKLRRMNLGGIADDIESIISRNARLTADNRRHMQRIEALERECGQQIQQITSGAAAVPESWREAVQEFVDRCDRGEIRSVYTYNKFSRLLRGVQ